jgi:hypothetical protein
MPAGPAGGDPTTPFEVVVEWLTGQSPRNHEFREGDPFTELLQQSDYIGDVRARVAESVSEGNYGPFSEGYNLGGLQGVPKYAKDYSTLFTGGKTGNLAVTYLGSYSLDIWITGVNRDNGAVQAMFNVKNTSNIESLTHPPVIGYTDFWSDSIAPVINGAASSITNLGPMSPTTQDFWWTETIP